MQLTQLSAVAEVTPYEVPIERGEPRSVVTLFDGSLDDGSSLRSRGLEDLNRRGLQLKPYGKTQDSYTSSSLPPDEILRHMPWLRRIRPVMRFRSCHTAGSTPCPSTKRSRFESTSALADRRRHRLRHRFLHSMAPATGGGSRKPYTFPIR